MSWPLRRPIRVNSVPASRPRRAGQLFAAPVAIGLSVLVACASSAGDVAEPSCNEELQATGEGLPVAPGIAIAVSYQIEVTHPELGRVVDAAIEYERANPRFLDLDTASRDDDDPLIGGGEFGSLGTLLVLVDRSDLATPEVLDALEDAAREGGFGGVGNSIRDARPGDPAPYGSDDFLELGSLVYERTKAVEDSELVPLPAPMCQPQDDEG